MIVAHRWLVLVLGLATGLRLAVAVEYRPALFFGDSWEYLDMAYKAFPVGSSHFHPSGYPFLIKVLSVAGNHLTVITTAQHLAGLVVGLLVYLLLTRAGIARWLAAVATGVVTLDLYAITLEQTIVSEAFFTLALFGSAYLAVRSPLTWRTVLASGALLAAATLIRVGGVYAFPVWFLYLAWRRVGWRPLLVAGLSFALPLLGYAAIQQNATGRFGLVEADGWFLYGRVGEIAAPCGGAKIPSATRALCESQVHPVDDPAFYIFESGSPARKRFGGAWVGTRQERAHANRLLSEFSVAIIRDRPRVYTELVLRDFKNYFVPGRRTGSRAEDLPTAPERGTNELGKRVLAHHFSRYEPRRYRSETFLSRLERWLHTPRWLMALFAGCGLAVLTVAVIRRGRRSRGNRGSALFLLGSGVLTLLGSAAISGFVLRYVVPEVPLLVCGGVLAIHELTGARFSPPPSEDQPPLP